MSWSDPLFRLVAALALPLLVMALIGATVERVWPAAPRRRERGGVNLTAWGALTACHGLVLPAFGGLTTLAVNAAGGGLVALPTHGWGWGVGLCAYFLAMDLGEYLFHRAQHAIPALWAMHSLHHSDRDFDTTTTNRHFWAEPLIKAVTIWLAVAMMFKTPPSVAMAWMAASYWHYIVHSNCRLDFGRWSWALNGPSYHRVHHSRLPEHFDVNFAALFPVFDLLLGSYRRARPGEAVPTGLDTGEAPRNAWEAVSWPVRGRRHASEAPALASVTPG